jgi:heterodisulfide reductase subunit C
MSGPWSVVRGQLQGTSLDDVTSLVAACLQCRKCTSGCPVAGRVDIKPHEVVQLVRLGQADEVLKSRLIWECTSCQTCATRCPQKVSIAALNDALRQLSRRQGKTADGNTVAIFNDTFLKIVKRKGRMHEVGLMARYKLRTRRFFEDMGKGPMMFRKGKLTLFSKSMAGKAQRKALFDRVADAGGTKR